LEGRIFCAATVGRLATDIAAADARAPPFHPNATTGIPETGAISRSDAMRATPVADTDQRPDWLRRSCQGKA
jgi:hypothetical protein